ncbi:MAG: EAL domain-containing protein [Clostridium sp.]|nr:EAL domain-containing protein [Clostridium sp.]
MIKLIESLNYQEVIDSLDIVVWQYNEETNKLNFSENYKMILGIKEDIESFEDLYSFIDSEDAEYIKVFFSELIKNRLEEKFILEFVIVNDNNKRINIECSGKGLKKQNNYVITGAFLDTTEKVGQENKLRISEKRYRKAFEGSKYIMFYINLKEKYITLDGKVSKLIGVEWKSQYKFTIEQWLDFIIYEEREIYKKKFYEMLESNESKYFSIEYRIRNKFGRVLWIKIKGKRISEEDGEYIYGSISDETDRKEKEIKINYMSYYDDVTGVPNRRYFMINADKMRQTSLVNKKIFALVFIDLDDFKYVNDNYGHAVGDIVLKSFCEKIAKIINRKCFFARFGGDEFVISIENINNENEVINIVMHILEECNIPMQISNKEIFNTVSIGVSMCFNRGESIQSLLKKADIAMYKAKSTGKNKFLLFNKDMSDKVDRELNLSRCIRKSIENNEIYFLMQPKYWAKSKKMQGFEVLARWNSEELGFVSPEEFIPTAEDNGYIIEIGKFLIRDSLKKCKILKDKMDNDFKIAINLSEIQIRDENLISFVKQCIIDEGVDPKNIEFEVTETVIMTSLKNNIKVLEELKALGVSIALDDFGVGYSSLNYLRNLPIDTVKIDKSFVYDINKDFKGKCIIEKIVELAHLLDLKVVAEGVENKEQFEFLRNIDCDMIQGYYFSKPATFDKILELIK